MAMRDLKYPQDAELAVENLRKNLAYDAAVAALGNAATRLPAPGEGDFSIGVRYGDCGPADVAVRRDAAGLLSRFALISMVSRFETTANNLLLQRRFIEALGGPATRISGKEFLGILKSVHRQSREGIVRLCTKLVVKHPSSELKSRVDWLEGISRVRNCLAHRLGQVQLVDVAPPGGDLHQVKESDVLRAKWVRMIPTIGGRDVTTFPSTDHGGGTVGFRTEEYVREWKVGDMIGVTPGECQAIASTLALLGNHLLGEFQREIDGLLRTGTNS